MSAVDQAAQTASVLANAAQNAGQMEQAQQQAAAAGQPAPKTSPFDVLSHTGSGLAKRDLGDQIMAQTPAGAMVGLFHTMTSPAHASAPSAIPAAMGQGWDAVKAAAAGVGQAKGALATVGAAFGTLVAFEQMLSMALSAIPFPAFPAVRILDMDIGLPHAHMHPPNLIPPAPPVPLPSTGPVIPIPFVSGASKTLINGMPAARCGDIGLGIWCGGYFPMYEIFLGSSNVWIEGNRAARVAVDITKHCIFTSPKPSDPPAGPMIGFTITSSANVLIGGIPMPSLVSLAMGALFKALFKGLGKLFQGIRKRFGKGRAPANNRSCTAGEPINVVTGANFGDFEDFRIPGPIPFVWRRHYSTTMSNVAGAIGFGFRHEYERELRRLGSGFEYQTQEGECVGFQSLDPQTQTAVNDGLLLWKTGADVFEIHEAGSPVMEFQFLGLQSLGRLTALRSGKQITRFEYDAENRLTTIRLPTAESIRATNDAAGRISELQLIRSGGDRRTLASYSYDAEGNLSSAADALGNAMSYLYDARHWMTRNTDRGRYSFHYTYDDAGRCLGSRGDDGLYECQLQYFPAERRTVVTYADGAATTYRFNEQGTIIELVNPGGHARTFVTNDRGQVVQEIDAQGNVTEWLYDTWGGNIGRRDPLGHVYGPLHLDPNPPNPLEQHLPSTPVEWEYGGLIDARVAGAATPEDPLLHFCPPNVANEFLDDVRPRGTDPDRAGQVAHDATGREILAWDDRGAVERVKYDSRGSIVEWQDRDGATSRARYSSWNKLSEVIDANGAGSRYEYTLREYLTRISDAGGTLSEYVYNQLDQIVAVRRHGKVREQYGYDEAGNLVTKSDGQGRRLVRWKIGPGNVEVERHLADGESQVFQRDKAGRVVGATWSGGTKVHAAAFDIVGRRTKDLRNGKGVIHQFDRTRLAATTWFGKFTARYRWPTNRQLEITDPTGTIQQFHISPTGGLVVRRLANGSAEACQYDAAGRAVRKAAWHGMADTNAWRRTFQHSHEGELRRVDDSERGATRYEYDAAHRLRTAATPDGARLEFLYDAAGNLLAQPGLTGVAERSGNRLSAANGETFVYNDRDHIATRQGANGAVEYSYNSLDLMVDCNLRGTPWQAEYDPLGRRVSKSWNGETTEFHWDGDRLSAEVSTHSLRLYLYVDELALVPFMFVDYAGLDAEPDSGRCYYLFTNQIGVPERVEDEAGATVWRAAIEPYGRTRVAPESTVAMPLRFPGHYFDAETGLHCNRYRYYDPELARYIASDPLGIAGGINLYAYAPNPLRQVDLLGLAHGKQQKTPDPAPRGEGPKAAFATAKEATEAAEKLGFRKTNFKCHGQPVYSDGRRFISPDVDGHNGGVWKMADSVKNLGRKNTRMGTYNGSLDRIGD